MPVQAAFLTKFMLKRDLDGLALGHQALSSANWDCGKY